MAYAQVTLTGTYKLPNGIPAKGTVEIIPSEPLILDDAGNVVLSGRVKIGLEEDGSFDVLLPATDDPGLTPVGFGYTLAAKLSHTHLPAISFSLPAATATVDVTDVTQVDPSTFAPDANYVTDAELATALEGVVPDTSAIEADVTALDTRVTTVEGTVVNKADTSTVTALDGRVDSVETALPAKQDAATVDTAVTTLVNDPASATSGALSATYVAARVVQPGATSGTDTQAAITALGSAGGDVVLAAGTHTWDSIPKFPRDLTGRLTIRGAAGAVVTLTAAARRMFDFDYTADHQTFQHLHLVDLTVDAANLGGKHHVLVGTYVDGNYTGRLNLHDIRIERCRLFNLLTDSNTATNHRIGIYLTVLHGASGEATQNTITDVNMSDVTIEGGNAGILLGGGGPDSGVNVWSDNVTLERCYFDGLTTPTGFYPSSGFHLGGKGYGGRVAIRDCVSKNTGDNGIEVNAWDDALVDNCTVIDAANVGYYTKNFHPARDVLIQRVVWRSCRVLVEGFAAKFANGMYGRGFNMPDASSDNPFGEVRLEACETMNTNPGDAHAAGYGFRAHNIGVRRIHLDLRCEVSGFSVAPATSAFPTMVWLYPTTACVTTGRVVAVMAGEKTGGTTLSARVVNLFGTAHAVDLVVDADVNIPGMSNGAVILVNTGEYTTALSGRLHVVGKVVGDTGPYGVRLRSGTTVTKGLFVSGDFAGLAAGGREVVVENAAAKPLTHVSNVVWKSNPSISTKTVTASPYAYQNVSGWPEMVTVTGGTVTSVAHTYNGTATDAGSTSGRFLLQNGDTLTISYSSAPTVKAIPAIPKTA